MNKESKLKDLIGVTGGIIESLEGLKFQSKQRIKSKIVSILRNYSFVEREEFNEIKAMALKAREENIRLAKKISSLENKIKKS